MKNITGIVAVALVMGLGACSTGDSTNTAASALAMRAGFSQDSWDPVPHSLSESMPSVKHLVGEKGTPLTNSDAVVRGTFVSWKRGPAEVWTGNNGGNAGRTVDWDSKEAETRMLLMDFHPSEVIDGDQRAGKGNQTVWVAVDGSVDPDRVAEGLISAKESVLFLSKPRFRDAQGAKDWVISLDGALWLPLQGNELTSPVIEEMVNQDLVGPFTELDMDVDTLQELKTLGDQPDWSVIEE